MVADMGEKGASMQEWPIKDVARATGLTSRTLRHYEQIGLLRPSRVASNGYRFYGDAELSRLYRILSLRALEVPLADIRIALGDDASLVEDQDIRRPSTFETDAGLVEGPASHLAPESLHRIEPTVVLAAAT
jgi:DNA-binding transcriptional MerR regulator